MSRSGGWKRPLSRSAMRYPRRRFRASGADPLQAAFEQLQVQLALGWAEERDAYAAQKQKIQDSIGAFEAEADRASAAAGPEDPRGIGRIETGVCRPGRCPGCRIDRGGGAIRRGEGQGQGGVGSHRNRPSKSRLRSSRLSSRPRARRRRKTGEVRGRAYRWPVAAQESLHQSVQLIGGAAVAPGPFEQLTDGRFSFNPVES